MQTVPKAAQLPVREPPVEEITRAIVDAFAPERVVMFGSRARGDHQPDSDIDVFVEMETDLKPFDRMRAVAALFPARRWSMDVIVFTPAEVREHRGYRNSILRAVETEGRVLYQRPAPAPAPGRSAAAPGEGELPA